MANSLSENSLSRRDFLRLSATTGLGLALNNNHASVRDWFLGTEAERFISLTPRQDIALNGFYMIPEDIAQHFSEEKIIFPLQLEPLIKKYREGLRLGLENTFPEYNIYADGYLQGAIEAHKRNQDVTMVLEMPTDDTVPPEEWKRYIDWLIPQIGAGKVVIGNEILHTELTKQGSDWSKYGQCFSIAYDAVKKYHPDAKIILTSPEYFGQAEVLRTQIEAIGEQNTLRESKGLDPITVDGIAIHFYDEAHLLPGYIKIQKDELSRHPGLETIPIYLTEYGVPEKEREKNRSFTDRHQTQYHIKLGAMAAAMINQGEITAAYPYTAFSPGEDMHSVFSIHNNITVPKPAYMAYELSRRFVHHGALFSMKDNIAEISGYTSDGKPSRICWNIGKDLGYLKFDGGTGYTFDRTLKKEGGNGIILETPDNFGRSGSAVIVMNPQDTYSKRQQKLF